MSTLIRNWRFEGESWDTPPKDTYYKIIHKLVVAAGEIGEPAIAALNEHLDKYPEDLEVNDRWYSWTPLLWAAYFATSDVVQLLVDKGANIDHQSIYGFTALILAVSNSKIDNCRVLLEAGADLTLKDEYNNDAFDYAETKPEILDLLNNPYQIPDHIRYNIDKINDPEYYMNITL